MSNLQLTSEQKAVIQHPLGRHARVLAVAGSGKTTTMAYRIKHLVTRKHVSPKSIQVLMFNRLAREQFQERLEEIGVPPAQQPPVDTFHSYSYGLIRDAIQNGLLPRSTDFWLDGRGERMWLFTNIAITNLERRDLVPPGVIDVEEASQAISLWKNSLIPPERAGYRGSPYLPLVYQEYEKLRQRKNALTFDDFVPLAVRIVKSQGRPGKAHVIVDEYQDINYGQQVLIELLAGKQADVMVVGDDDQTIYEWRGARPTYIIREFQSVFENKPHTDYTLSRSFRFGPVIAQCAFNTISRNTDRVEKQLIAHRADKVAEVEVIEGHDSNRFLAEWVIELVKHGSVPPSEIRVLVRTFAQLAGLEAEFLDLGIPYRVVGRQPFFERRENRVLLDYVRLALALDQVVTKQAEKWLLSVANTPSRMLGRKALSRAMSSARFHQLTAREALVRLGNDPDSELYYSQLDRVIELTGFLGDIWDWVRTDATLRAGQLLQWMVNELDYLDHFEDYYGAGWESLDRQRAVQNFIDFASGTGLGPQDFIEYIDGLDTTRGVPEDQQIVFTTVFREKGCEYDYVLIPDCLEGYMPCLRESGSLVYDKAGQVEEPEPSQAIENERRLFYVALTRAKKAVYIGTVVQPKNGTSTPQPSRFLDEMRRTPSVRIMDALQRVASGDQQAKAELLKWLQVHGNIPFVTRALTSEYLKDVGDTELLAEVSRLVPSLPEIPFGYTSSLEAPTTPRRTDRLLHRAWRELPVREYGCRQSTDVDRSTAVTRSRPY